MISTRISRTSSRMGSATFFRLNWGVGGAREEEVVVVEVSRWSWWWWWRWVSEVRWRREGRGRGDHVEIRGRATGLFGGGAFVQEGRRACRPLTLTLTLVPTGCEAVPNF